MGKDYYSLLKGARFPNLTGTMYLGYIGNSSLNSVLVLSDADSNKEVVRNVHQVVMVDTDTRRPKKIPDWWKRKYQNWVIGNQALVSPKLKSPPNNDVHIYSITVAWNEVDGYSHINYASYIKFCFDTAMDGVAHGVYSRLHQTKWLYNVKKWSLFYKGESKVGDLLHIASWEDTDDPYILNFDITRGGQTIFQSHIEFNEPMEHIL